MSRILHLILYRKWFMEILAGVKRTEFRSITPYWTRKLFSPDGTAIHYDEISFRNGYRKDAPVMRIEFLGVRESERKYAIDLGRILEVKNVEEGDLEKQLSLGI